MKNRRSKKLRRALLSLLAVLMLAAAPALWEFLLHGRGVSYPLSGTPDPALAGQNAVIHVIDVGQGDAILLEQGGHYALLDTGTRESRDALTLYLDSHGVRKLDYLLLTHFHADHIGGAQQILENYPVDTVLLPDVELGPAVTSMTGLNLLEQLNELADAGKIRVKVPGVGDVFPLGRASLEIICAGIPAPEEMNNTSLAALFTFDNFTMYSAGDAEVEEEQALLELQPDLPRADLYKVSHHGSDSSSSPALLGRLQPALAVISCGRGNSYGHPHRATLDALASCGSVILRTDLNGNVRVRAGDGEMKVFTEK